MSVVRRWVVSCVVLVAWGCAGFRADPRETGPVQDTPPVIVEPVPPQPAIPELSSPEQLLMDAAQQTVSGSYESAAASYRRLAEEHPSSPHAAQALFQLAALRWNPASPVYDARAAIAALQELASEHPDSPWTPAATAILALARDKASLERAVATLQQQLDELKQLDLAPDG